VLIGHGALNKASGASMIRHAALLKKNGTADFATAGFLNFSKPSFADAVQRCADKGTSEIIVQPYFLINGYYVDTVLRKLVDEAKETHPNIQFTQMQPFGDHPALAQLVIKRLHEAEETLEPLPHSDSAILLMAHGTPKNGANEPIYQIAKRVEGITKRSVTVAFMECNEPSIPEAIETQIKQGFKHITAVPYFLQKGGHVRNDLPDALSKAKEDYSKHSFLLAEHLDYDELLINVIQTRVLDSLLD